MNVLNEHYKAATKEVKSIDRKAVSLYGNLGAFVLSVCYDNGIAPMAGTDIKPTFAFQERMAVVEEKVKMGENSTYRSIKSVLCTAVGLGVVLIDSAGNLKGKSEVEAEIKALKNDKTELEKFKSAIETATHIKDKLLPNERLIAAGLVDDLLKTMKMELKIAA
jgi:hypothetical protein